MRHQHALLADQRSMEARHIHTEQVAHRTMLARRHQQLQDSRRTIQQDWQTLVDGLQRERGLWGPSTPNVLNKWMLDVIEGPSRMRKRMAPNRNFYRNYPYNPEIEAFATQEELNHKVGRRLMNAVACCNLLLADMILMFVCGWVCMIGRFPLQNSFQL
jgi:hypothetical protein